MKLVSCMKWLTCAVALVGCSSSSSSAGPAGGAVQGALDAHCGSTQTTVDPSTCHVPPPADAGAADYGATCYGTEADDDDCKYHVTWTSTPIRQNTDVTFTITSKNRAGGAPTTGAEPRLEIYLNDTHLAPNTKQAATETSPGVYSVGPVRFDAPGRWTVRFHFSETCNDGEHSPHGHVAFFVDVP